MDAVPPDGVPLATLDEYPEPARDWIRQEPVVDDQVGCSLFQPADLVVVAADIDPAEPVTQALLTRGQFRQIADVIPRHGVVRGPHRDSASDRERFVDGNAVPQVR